MAQKLDISTAREQNQSACVTNIAQDAKVKLPIGLHEEDAENVEHSSGKWVRCTLHSFDSANMFSH